MHGAILHFNNFNVFLGIGKIRPIHLWSCVEKININRKEKKYHVGERANDTDAF